MIKNENNTLDLFIEHHDEDLRRLVATRFRNYAYKNSVEDLVQDIYAMFVKDNILGRWDSTKGSSLSSWIYMVVKHHCCNRKRHLQYKSRDGLDHVNEGFENLLAQEGKGSYIDRFATNGTYESDDPNNRVFVKEIENFIQKKHPKHLQLFLLFKQDLPMVDIAEKMGISIQGVSQKHRLLAAILSKHFKQKPRIIRKRKPNGWKNLECRTQSETSGDHEEGSADQRA